MKIRFLRHNVSNGCSDIATKLKELGHDVKKLRLTGSTYRGHSSHMIVNWGRHNLGELREGTTVINPPKAVIIASHKVKTFTAIASAGMSNNIPKFTTSRSVAEGWFNNDLDDEVYCRTLVNSSQGRGIVVATCANELVEAPLYTSKVVVERELRIHVFNGEIIDFAQKKRMSSQRREECGFEGEVDDSVRSSSNGWIFARRGVTICEESRSVAIRAVEACGLTFGAVDIAINEVGVPKVYEINTAPGAEGGTIDSYANAIDRYIMVGGR
jgi:hypothetical protein